ncbi:pentapeptide repeat-containing protein [Microbacterium sp. NPDC057659]|uniref:pentapeptide repeat-containing protein n=1 Tax=Microbacterium sp. NPDC057659 TaxID=3346198 RepID=UPI00366C4ADE
MPAIRPVPPRVSAPDLPDHLTPARAQRRADLLAASVECAGETDLAHGSLEQCVLTGAADRVDLTGATLLDVRIEDLRAPVVSLRDASIRRLRIDRGRIGTLDLSTARIGELEIRGARIDYLSLGGARAEDVLIADTTLHTLDVPQATLTRVRFDGTRADEVDPRGLTSKDVDLRGLDALAYLDVLSLRGATLASRQVELLAPAFATAAGIDVQD